MQQAKFSLSEPLLEFLSHYRQYGYKDKSAMVQAALLHMQRNMSSVSCGNPQHSMPRCTQKTPT